MTSRMAGRILILVSLMLVPLVAQADSKDKDKDKFPFLEATVAQLGVAPQQLLAWMGPAIGVQHFEVGAEVRSAFVSRDAAAATAFSANTGGRWQCDLSALARARLAAAGVTATFGGDWCTYSDPQRFFSYRRDRQCGRMAALIWLT